MHNINTYIGRQSAWHKLGTVTGKHMSWPEMVALEPSLNFDVFKAQLEFNGVKIDSWGTFRSDNGVFLGNIGENYTPIQHREGFEMVDALVGSIDGAHYETAGVLGIGQMVWGLADLKLTIRVGDDEQNGYLLFSTGHDGSMSHTYRTCMTRVVCNNTLNIALNERSRSAFRVRHSKKAAAKLADAHTALKSIQADTQTIEQKLNFLAGRKVTRETMTDIMDRLFPKRLDADGNPVNPTRRMHTLETILSTYEENDNDVFPEQRGTAYNLLNAFTNYTDHQRAGDKNRAESALFGSGDKFKSQALQVILEAADGMPVMKQRTILTSPVPALQPVPNSDSPMLDALLSSYGD